MPAHSPKDPRLAALRRRAETQQQGRGSDAQPASTEELRLLHELHVHQVELEIQNEELREAQAASQAALERYTALYDFAPVGYLTLDKAGTIVQLNLVAARLLGAERARLVGQSVWHFIEARDRAAFRTFVAGLLSSPTQKGHCEITLRSLAKGTPRRHIQIEAVAGEMGQLRAVAVDMTETKQMIEELLRSNEELQQFAFVAAHDLQTPLRSITSFAQLLHQKFQAHLDEQANAWFAQLHAAARRMHDLVRDLLAYSRQESRGARFGAVAMDQLFDEVVATLQEPIRDSGAHVTSDALPTVTGDRLQLAQVLQHLIDNAIKYRSGAAPEIHVSARRETGEWRFSVQDNGIGIAGKHQNRIFDIFKRLHTQQDYPGTGIGLAICRRVIQRHGGRIWVESEPGKGSVFQFTLPDRDTEEAWFSA